MSNCPLRVGSCSFDKKGEDEASGAFIKVEFFITVIKESIYVLQVLAQSEKCVTVLCFEVVECFCETFDLAISRTDKVY